MNKKIVGVILCVFLFLFGAIPVTGETPIDNLEIDPDINSYIDQIFNSNNQNLDYYYFLSYGPVSKTYSNVKLLNGSANQIEKINSHLNRNLFRSGIILKYIPVLVVNLSFTVEYKKDIGGKSRYSYMSGHVKPLWNETTGELEGFTNYSFVVNKAHKVNVENMTGIFIFQRFRLYDRTMPLFRKFLQPAKFYFIGVCENITYLEDLTI